MRILYIMLTIMPFAFIVETMMFYITTRSIKTVRSHRGQASVHRVVGSMCNCFNP